MADSRPHPLVMTSRQYYSARTGKNPQSVKVDLETFRKLFKTVYDGLERDGYFQQSCGYYCVDAGFVPGELGHDLAGAVLLNLRKEGIVPIEEKVWAYTEEDLFDVIEFLFDQCSKPTRSHYHSYSNCGLHADEFDRPSGQAVFRERMGPILELYADGFELNQEGEILALADSGLEELLEAPISTDDPDNIETRIEDAKRRFRRHRSTLEDRRHAVRDLADVLEYLRPKLAEVLTRKDEADLFQLANNFGIRHHNDKQKVEYDQAIFYSWLFYYYLAALHAALRLIRRSATQAPG